MQLVKMASHKIDKMILFQRIDHVVELNAPKEISWNEALANSKDVDCVEMNSNELSLYFVYLWNHRCTKRNR